MSSDTISPARPLETAVLFLVFNRPDTTVRVFDEIRKARPPRLYVAADGPRPSRAGEGELVERVRKIATLVDWPCEVKTLFRDQNLGCKLSVSRAITWFFDHEEEGIILEDDCLPSQSFFWFCESLLRRYKNDLRIWNIGGYRHSYCCNNEEFYTFSIFPQIWGWATWRDRWNYYDVNLGVYRRNKNIVFDYDYFKKKHHNEARVASFEKIINGQLDTWDAQWNFAVRTNNGLSVRPIKNLIKNIGFGSSATHTTEYNASLAENNFSDIEFPVKHPPFIMVYKKYDDEYAKIFFDHRYSMRVMRKIVRMLNKYFFTRRFLKKCVIFIDFFRLNKKQF